jgi:hypothetical protein
VSSATTFSIQEVSGNVKDTIRLRQRALPYQPLEFSGTMRAVFTYYAGSPVATVQMLGAEEGETTVNGTWKDRFLGEHTLGPGHAWLNGSPMWSAQEVAFAMDKLRRKGRMLRVSWDKLIRYGVLTKFTTRWLRKEDIEWEATFTWVSQTDPTYLRDNGFTNVRARNGIGSLNMELAALQTAFQGAPTMVWVFSPNSLLSYAQSLKNLYLSGINQVNDLLIEWDNGVNLVAATIQQPIDASRRALAILTGIERVVDSTLDTAIETGRAAVSVTDQASLDVRQFFSAKLWHRRMDARFRKLRRSTSDMRRDLEALVHDPVLGIHRAKEGETLRYVSLLFYGTAHEWQHIARFNGLADSKSLTPGIFLYIPRLSQSST